MFLWVNKRTESSTYWNNSHLAYHSHKKEGVEVLILNPVVHHHRLDHQRIIIFNIDNDLFGRFDLNAEMADQFIQKNVVVYCVKMLWSIVSKCCGLLCQNVVVYCVKRLWSIVSKGCGLLCQNVVVYCVKMLWSIVSKGFCQLRSSLLFHHHDNLLEFYNLGMRGKYQLNIRKPDWYLYNIFWSHKYFWGLVTYCVFY